MQKVITASSAADAAEAVEYAAWQLAAEPAAWRMEHLLRVVREHALLLAGQPEEALRLPEEPEGIILMSVPDDILREPEAQPERFEGAGGSAGSAALAEAPRAVVPRKRCAGCERHLAQDAFSSDKTRKDGLRSRCKPCVARQRRERLSRKKQGKNEEQEAQDAVAAR